MTFNALYCALFWLSSISPSPLVVTAPGSAGTNVAPNELASLKAQFPQARITMAVNGQIPRIISGIKVPTMGSTPRTRAEDFLTRFGHITGATTFRYSGESQSRNMMTIRFEQLHQGYPVVDRNLTVRLDEEGFVRGMVSDVSPVQNVSEQRVNMARAAELAQEAVGVSNLETRSTRAWAVVGTQGTPIIEVELSRVPLAEHLVVRINAHEGQVLSISNRVIH